MSSYAYDLDKLMRYQLIEGQDHAIRNHYFKNFKDLGQRVIKIIHGFPLSFAEADFNVSDLEIYIGVALPDQLYKRFKSHELDKKHQYGIILGVSSSEIANYLEMVGIKLLKKLESNHNLCVKNQKAGGYSYTSSDNIKDDELIFYYMTVRVVVSKMNQWIRPNTEERSIIKNEMLFDLQAYNLTKTDKNHIGEVINRAHMSTHNEKVFWYK